MDCVAFKLRFVHSRARYDSRFRSDISRRGSYTPTSSSFRCAGFHSKSSFPNTCISRLPLPSQPSPPSLLSPPLPFHSLRSPPSLPPPPFSPSLPYSTHLNPHLGTHLPHSISSPLLPLNHLFFAIPIPPLLPHFLLLPPSPAHISPAHRTPPNAPNCPVLPPPLPTSAFPPPPAPHMTGTVVEVASPGHGRR